MSKSYHIRDLEEVSGIKAHTIRIWEKRYNLIEPQRTDTNIRYYDETTYKKFLLVTILYRNNFKISEISKFSLKEIEEKVLMLNNSSEDSELWTSEMMLTITNFDSTAFNYILYDAIFSLNTNKTILLILFPFLHKIDTLWKMDSITLLQKQFAFECGKSFLNKVIVSTTRHYPKGDKKIVLLCDDQDINILSLLYTKYVMNKANYKVIFLEKIMEQEYFFDNILSLNSDKIFTIASLNQDKNELFIENIKKFPRITFYILDVNYTVDIQLTNLILINNLEEIEDEIL